MTAHDVTDDERRDPLADDAGSGVGGDVDGPTENSTDPGSRPSETPLAGASSSAALAADAPSQEASDEPASVDVESGEAASEDHVSDEVASDEVASDEVASDEAVPDEVALDEGVSGRAVVGESTPTSSSTHDSRPALVRPVLYEPTFGVSTLDDPPPDSSTPDDSTPEAAPTSEPAADAAPLDEPSLDQHSPDEPVPDSPAPDAPDAAETAGVASAETTVALGADRGLQGPERDGSESELGPQDEAEPDAETPARTGWAAVRHAMTPRATRAQLIAGVLCALLGFAVVVQVRQNDESALAGLRQSELVRILDETTERGDQLRAEVSELRNERDELASGSDRQAAAIDSLRRSAITQGILSGRLPAQGPGVEVTLLDPADGLQPFTMLNLLEELRNAGAEAIQLNDQRITASSAFTGSRGAILLDGVPLEDPYVWLAIGDSSTLSIALQIPGGAMATVRGTGATGTVLEQDKVSVTAVRELPDPAYATPEVAG